MADLFRNIARDWGLGLFAGIIWAWASLALNSLTGVTEYEGTLVHDLASFTFAGAVMGLVLSGLLGLFYRRLPFKSIMAKSVFLSTAVWVLLKAGGTILSRMEPDRYHIINAEALQGLFLAVLLGVILGLLYREEDHAGA